MYGDMIAIILRVRGGVSWMAFSLESTVSNGEFGGGLFWNKQFVA
jgi:hypothetical protein